jgi:SNF2 family DNA or RNA helicase
MQAVGFIELLRVKCGRPGPFIVVVPLSTIRHWQKEFDERSRANTVVLHGTNEDRDSFVGSEFTGKRIAQCGRTACGLHCIEVILQYL